jgi:hypothetical protein
MELSEPVLAAVPEAVKLVQSLVEEIHGANNKQKAEMLKRR